MTEVISEQPSTHTQVKLSRAYLAASILIALVAGAGWILNQPSGSPLSFIGWILTWLSLLPLVIAQLALGHPGTWRWLRARTGGRLRVEQRWMLLPIGCYVLGGLAVGRFDPYATAVVMAGVFVTIGTLAEVGRGYPRIVWTDTTFWFFLWVPFDFRWIYDLWYGAVDLTYSWWAIMLSVVTVYGYGVIRDFPGLGYRLIPRWRDLGIALVATAGLLISVVPISLAIDFLTLSPTTVHLPTVIFHFISVGLTVAIPEELFFRGLMQSGLAKHLRDVRPALVVTALAYGLAHWNNADAVVGRLAYMSLATVAGLFYGWAFERSNGLLAPILSHTLANLIWRLGFGSQGF